MQGFNPVPNDVERCHNKASAFDDEAAAGEFFGLGLLLLVGHPVGAVVLHLNALPVDISRVVDGDVLDAAKLRLYVSLEDAAMQVGKGGFAVVVEASVNGVFQQFQVVRGEVVAVICAGEDFERFVRIGGRHGVSWRCRGTDRVGGGGVRF